MFITEISNFKIQNQLTKININMKKVARLKAIF